MSEITYLFAYYILVCRYAIGCVSIRYVKQKLCKCFYSLQSRQHWSVESITVCYIIC